MRSRDGQRQEGRGFRSMSFLVPVLEPCSGVGVPVWIRESWQLTRHLHVLASAMPSLAGWQVTGLAELSLALHREVSKAPEEP